MVHRYQKIYGEFSCIAAACPDSCCKKWDVLVDEETALRYQTQTGPLGEYIRGHLRQEDGEWYFSIVDGRCPMWREDGLCRIQAQKGHEALCQTCRDFPRLRHDYGDFVEHQLELSCPEAARLILTGEQGWEEQTQPGGEAPDYDREDMDILLQTRQEVLRILQDSRFSVKQSLTLALLYGYRAQDALDGEELTPFNSTEELAFAASVAGQTPGEALAPFYQTLEILTPQWRALLAQPCGDGSWDGGLRRLACYSVERYWLQAISDFDLVGRVKMIVAACLLVRQLGGQLLRTAQLYAKEIENNIDNVEAILDGAYAHPLLTDANLLRLLR